MKEWFLSSDLMELLGMPSSTAGISKKARKEGWISRKARGAARSLEYHISSFDPFVVAQLREKFGDNHGKEGECTPDNVTSITNIKSVKRMEQLGKMCAIPVYNVYASCGFGEENSSEYQIRTELLPCAWLARFGLDERTGKIIECHGNSMEPTLSDGDEVLVDSRDVEHPAKDGVYVVRIGKFVYIKRLKYNILEEGYDVISDNRDEYAPFTISGDRLTEFKIVGKVVTTVMKAVV